MVEFASHGFEGASTRAIAARAGAHQPQINYHFESKEALWKAVLEQLLDEIDAELGLDGADASRETMVGVIRGLVRFAARRPELNRIMIQEGTNPGARLEWLVETHVAPRARLLTDLWDTLVRRGEAAPVPSTIIYHLLIGAASLLHANGPEFRLLFDADPSSPEVVDAHSDALVALLLPTPT